jgi:hypothetical protein
MGLLKVVETSPGNFSLLLSDFDKIAVAEIVEELDHEPGGYFWEGVAKTLVRTSAPELEDQLSFDSEAGMFCAYGQNEAALRKLGELMELLFDDEDRMRALMEDADPDDFDD